MRHVSFVLIIISVLICCKEEAAFSDAVSAPVKQAELDRKEAVLDAFDKEPHFDRRWQSEFGFFGGSFGSDAWQNSWDIGGRYILHINKIFAIGAEYMYSPIRDDDAAFLASLKTKATHTIDGQLIIGNDCFLRAGRSVIATDLYLTLGMGSMRISEEWKESGVVGGGIKVYMPVPWIALRFDINTYIHPTPNPSGEEISADVVSNLGFSVMFPVKKLSP